MVWSLNCLRSQAMRRKNIFLRGFFCDAPTIINWLALCAIVLFVLIRLGLIGWTFSQPSADAV
ncbi:hypothetical protein ASD99_29215 [Mesorhizobium sp. Root695]|nr:hypothetical protein ASD99_29215 [Mesorhizobium sp. Root695]